MAAVSKLIPTPTRLLYYDTMEDMRKAALSSCIVFISHQARSLLSWAPPLIVAEQALESGDAVTITDREVEAS